MAAATADEKVMQLFEVVKQKKAEVSKAEKPTWNTNCSFGYSEESSTGRINIQVVADLSVFISIVAFLNEKERAFKEAAEELGIQQEFKWLGFTAAEWKADVVLRINKIQISKKKKELEMLEARLSNLISPELRAKLELEDIESLLK